jgi:hypothetical protein
MELFFNASATFATDSSSFSFYKANYFCGKAKVGQTIKNERNGKKLIKKKIAQTSIIAMHNYQTLIILVHNC